MDAETKTRVLQIIAQAVEGHTRSDIGAISLGMRVLDALERGGCTLGFDGSPDEIERLRTTLDRIREYVRQGCGGDYSAGKPDPWLVLLDVVGAQPDGRDDA